MTNLLPRFAAALSALSLVVISAPALASSGGISSNSFGSSGCNQCHSGGTAPKVELTGPAKLDGGAEGTFTFKVTDLGGKQGFAGLNVRAEGGTLATGGPDEANTKTVNGAKGAKEITHSSRKAAEGGAVTFSFVWTAPTDGSGCAPVTLRAWGNAVNGASSSGDAAEETTLQVEVCNEGAAGAGGSGGSGQAGAGGSDAGAGGSDAGSGGSDAGSGGTAGSGGSPAGSGGSSAGSGGSAAGSGGSTAGSSAAGSGDTAAPAPAEDDGGCSMRGPGREGSGAAMLLVLGLLASRRRR
jgi:MYXO-CTERM domain-containing protein